MLIAGRSEGVRRPPGPVAPRGKGLGIDLGGDGSFDLDLLAIPCHGDRARISRHCVWKRSRRKQRVFAFLAGDAEARLFCWANAAVRKSGQNDEIQRFADYWRKRIGARPHELIIDSRLATHIILTWLDQNGDRFRRAAEVDQVAARRHRRRPQVRLATRAAGQCQTKCRTSRILEFMVRISRYPDDIRKIAVRVVGRDKPTLLPARNDEDAD